MQVRPGGVKVQPKPLPFDVANITTQLKQILLSSQETYAQYVPNDHEKIIHF